MRVILNTPIRAASAATLGLAFAACTSGNSGVTPPQSGPIPTSVAALGFAVGTANISDSADGVAITQSLGLNTVVTYRKADGSSGVLVNTPTITGPAGFLVPTKVGAGLDEGTNHISGTPQAPPTAVTPPTTTFNQSGGAFSYGFLPDNSNNQFGSGASYATYSLPFYGAPYSFAAPSATAPAAVATGGNMQNLQGGFPAYVGSDAAHPNFRDGTYPTGFTGYSQGFADFLAAPVSGTYSINLVVPTNPTSTGSATATANLNAGKVLPTYPKPAVTEVADANGNGGLTVTLAIPAGVTETIVDIIDYGGGACQASQNPPLNYSLVSTTPGPAAAVALTLPANAGPIEGNGTQDPALCAGDVYTVTAIGLDYPAFEAGVPQNHQQNPTLLGAAGQADLTQAYPVLGTFASGVAPLSHRHRPLTPQRQHFH